MASRPFTPFAPFANDTDVLSIHGDALTITNDPSRIVLAGSLELTKDKAGLAAAMALADAVATIVERLRSEGAGLPESIGDEPPGISAHVKNPFI